MVQYDYAWSNGNQTVAMQLLAASNTSKNETWTCTVTPSDGRASGPAGSASLTVPNSMPPPPPGGGGRPPPPPRVPVGPERSDLPGQRAQS